MSGKKLKMLILRKLDEVCHYTKATWPSYFKNLSGYSCYKLKIWKTIFWEKWLLRLIKFNGNCRQFQLDANKIGNIIFGCPNSSGQGI